MSHEIPKTDNSHQADKKTDASTPELQHQVESLLQSREIAKLPKEEQGRVILDSFIGLYVRHGAVEGPITYDLPFVLELMDGIQKESDLTNFTRQGGLRASVRALAEDGRSGQQFGKLQSRIESNSSGEITFTTAEQVVSYLSHGDNSVNNPISGVDMPGTNWVGVVAERATGASEWINNPYKGIIESDIPSLNRAGNEWRMAVSSARKAGVDTALLARSSTYIRAAKLSDQT